jgi:cytidylate kinase
MNHKRIVVAIDGPAGAGKSTVARTVAARLGFVYVDSGAMYRAVALWAMRAGILEQDILKLEQLARESHISFVPGDPQRVKLNGDDVTEAIRTPEVSAFASKVSAIPGVRRALVDLQRTLASDTSVVMEGRDIGSVVFPDAEVKIFLDAPPSVRVGRRTRELTERGAGVDQAQTQRELAERDHRDRTRSEAPLVQAPDAVYIDSGGLGVEDVAEAVLKVIRDRTTNGKEYSR